MMKGLRKVLLAKYFLGLIVSCLMSGCIPENIELPITELNGEEEELGTPAVPIAEAVDLGLSVKWASCNVGAESPEEYGGYYAWGDTEEKSDYSWSTYKWCNGSYDTQTKYCTDSSYGRVDNKTTLDPEDDVAHVKWGGNWRMPTTAELKELRTKCNWEWTTMNGVNGFQVTGPNGNSIFLPAAGSRDGGVVYGSGSYGYYWSATLYDDCSDLAYCLYFYGGYFGWSGYYRSVGRSVRPVYGEYKPQDFTVTTGDALNITSNSVELAGSLSSSSQLLVCGIIYGTSSSLSSTNGIMESYGLSYLRDFSITLTGLSANTTYYYRAFAIVDGEYVYGEVRSFTTESSTVTSGDAIDLGLSVKWASCNVGASSPEEYGDYFAWGETTAKSSYWSSTSITDGLSISELESRCIIDADGNLTAACDAATANWGGSWRMPTFNEMKELISQCTWEWITQNGVKGRKVTGPNGNSIFLPAAGYRSYDSPSDVGHDGCYWSATPYSGSGYAYYLDFNSGNYGWDTFRRCYGHVVRPVSDK